MLKQDYPYYQTLFQKEATLTDAQLTEWIKIISMRSFNQPFLHVATFNHRLRTTGGRYHLSTHHIDINPVVFDKHGWQELVDVLLHELCHYHLHLTGQGYQHRDQDFKQLLKAVGGSRYVKPLVEETSAFHYQCDRCGSDFYRKKEIDVNKYRCQCRGYLKRMNI